MSFAQGVKDCGLRIVDCGLRIAGCGLSNYPRIITDVSRIKRNFGIMILDYVFPFYKTISLTKAKTIAPNLNFIF